MRAVVTGAGLAGLRAAEALRRGGFDGELTIVGDERRRPYNRPPLSKEVLLGTMDPEQCSFAVDDAALEATWLLGRAAAGLDLRRHVLALDDGERLPYDKLVIATGCRARPWPAPLELAGVHTLRTLDDAIVLREAAAGARHATIVGAGFLGCEVAASLRARGVEVALVDVAPHPMPPLGPELGARAALLHEAHGVALHLGAVVAGFDGRERVEAVRLGDGLRIETDLVLVAIGALPNVEWLAGSGLALHAGGVRCDAYGLAVGVGDVAAAGDVAAWPLPAAGGMVRVEHWTNAAEMAMRAAANLLLAPEERVPHAPVLTFWSDQYDVKIRAAGAIGRATERTIVREDAEHGTLALEGRRDGALVAGVTFNDGAEHLRHRRELARAAEGGALAAVV